MYARLAGPSLTLWPGTASIFSSVGRGCTHRSEQTFPGTIWEVEIEVCVWGGGGFHRIYVGQVLNLGAIFPIECFVLYTESELSL